MDTISSNSKRLIRLDEVKHKTGLSRSSIYQRIKEQSFPSCINLGAGGRSVGWLESEIDAWIESRIAERADQS